MLTALLLPWLRVAYLSLKRFVYQRVLAQPGRSVRAQRGNNAMRNPHAADGPEPVADTDEEYDTYETLEDGTLMLHEEGIDEHGVLLEDLEQEIYASPPRPITVYVTVYSLSKLIVQALYFPFVVNLAGGLLGRLAMYSTRLRAFLGIAPDVVPTVDLEEWIAALRHRHSTEAFFRQVQARKRAADAMWTEDFGVIYDNLDPMWFRNAIGGCVYLVIKDAFVLWYRCLRQWQRRRARIRDLPFSEGVARELILEDHEYEESNKRTTRT